MSFGSLVPEATIARNVMIMPMTVPMSPSNGPAATASRRNDWNRSSLGTSRNTASEIRSSASSRFLRAPPSPRNDEQHAAERIVLASGRLEILELRNHRERVATR